MSHLLKYNTTIRSLKKILPPTGDDEDEFMSCSKSDDISDHLKSGDIPDACKAMMFKGGLADVKSRTLLHEIFPDKYEERPPELYISTIRETQMSGLELGSFANDIKMELLQRAARRFPLCHVRKDVLKWTSLELLRQLLIDCPERGLLLKQVLDEYEKYFETYEILFRFNFAFLCRHGIKAKHLHAAQVARIEELNHDNFLIDKQVQQLKSTAEALERKNAELKVKGECIRKQELCFYKILGEQLKEHGLLTHVTYITYRNLNVDHFLSQPNWIPQFYK